MKVSVAAAESLNHQAELVSLVAPVAGEAVFTDVIRGEPANFGFGDFECSLVVNLSLIHI